MNDLIALLPVIVLFYFIGILGLIEGIKMLCGVYD